MTADSAVNIQVSQNQEKVLPRFTEPGRDVYMQKT